MSVIIALQRVLGGDIWSVYNQNYLFFDFVAYALILGGIAHYVLHKKFQKYSKPITIGLTLALTFAAISLEAKTNFRLSQLGPYASIILLLILAFTLYETLHALFGKSTKKCPIDAALTYLITYGLLITPLNPTYKWIEQTVPILASTLDLLMVAAAVILITCLWKMVSSVFKREDSSNIDIDIEPEEPE